jgi:hypothetical protein
MIRRISSDMVVVFWASHKCPRPKAHAAFDAEGLAGLLPSIDFYASIKDTAQHIVESSGIKAHGRVEFRGLSHDRNAVGVEARRLIKGAKKNALPFLFSIGAVSGDDDDISKVSVEVLECDPTLCPEIAQNRFHIEPTATNHFHNQCAFITANDLTNAITAMIKSCHGFLLRDGGILWYMPEDTIGPYVRIAEALEPYGVKMQTLRFDPVVNDSLVSHVCEELERRSMAIFQGMIDEAMEMHARGAKPRSNGQQTRLELWIETEATIQHNKHLLGKAFVKLSKAARAAKEAIGAEAVKAFQ